MPDCRTCCPGHAGPHPPSKRLKHRGAKLHLGWAGIPAKAEHRGDTRLGQHGLAHSKGCSVPGADRHPGTAQLQDMQSE